MKCPSCWRENPPDGRFCRFCGSPLSDRHALQRERPQEEATQASAQPRSPTHKPPEGADWGYSWDIKSFTDSAIERLGTMLRSLMNRTETTDDLAHGQVVIIAARWILVMAGLVLALWNPAAMGELQTQVVLLLGLAGVNFFLHARLLMGRPISTPVVYAASVADLTVISIAIIVGGGFDSGLYVFYFPALLAVSVAFRGEVAAASQPLLFARPTSGPSIPIPAP